MQIEKFTERPRNQIPLPLLPIPFNIVEVKPLIMLFLFLSQLTSLHD